MKFKKKIVKEFKKVFPSFLFMMLIIGLATATVYDSFTSSNNIVDWTKWNNRTQIGGTGQVWINYSIQADYRNFIGVNIDSSAGDSGAGSANATINTTSSIFPAINDTNWKIKNISFRARYDFGGSTNNALHRANLSFFGYRPVNRYSLTSGAFGENFDDTFVIVRNNSNLTIYDVFNNTGFDRAITPTSNIISFSGEASQAAAPNDVYTTLGIANLTFFIYPLVETNLTGQTNGTVLANTTIPFSIIGLPIFGNLTNATLTIYYTNHSIFQSSTQSLKGSFTNLSQAFINTTTFQTTGFHPTKYIVQGQSCAENTTNSECYTSTNNLTFSYGYAFNNHTFTNPVGELTNTNFILNLNISSGMSQADGYLIYNNTRYSATKTANAFNTIYTQSVLSPDISISTNISWRWELQISDGVESSLYNVTNGTQQVNQLLVDDCSTYATLILNYTLRDEDTRAIINTTQVQNSSIQVQVTITPSTTNTVAVIYNQTYTNMTNARVCFQDSILNTTNYRLDSVVQYSTAGRAIEFYNSRNLTLNNNTIPYNVNLYDLLNTNQEFKLSVENAFFSPVSDAVIEVYRQYIGPGQSLIVEAPITDTTGSTKSWLVLGDAYYTFVIKKENQVLGSFLVKGTTCEDLSIGRCEYKFTLGGSTTGFGDFNTINNISYSTAYNQTSQRFDLYFTSLDGIAKNVSINMSLANAANNVSICYDNLLATSGNVRCIAPAQYQNSSVYIVGVVDGVQFFTQQFDITISKSAILGAGRWILAVLALATIPMIGISSGALTIVFFIIGLVIVGLLNFVDYGGFIGPLSAFMFIVIAAIILLIKANSEEE